MTSGLPIRSGKATASDAFACHGHDMRFKRAAESGGRHHAGEALRKRAREIHMFGFDHQTQQRFGSRWPNQYPAPARKLRLDRTRRRRQR